MVQVLIILFFLLVPAGVIWLCRRVPPLGKIGPILILYVIGIVFGNLVDTEGLAKIQEALTGATVPLAIPLLLFGCTFSRSQTRSQLLAMLTGLVAVVAAVIAGYLIFGRGIPGGALIGGMLTGVYTGGTVNMAALKAMLDVPDADFVILNSYDMLASFIYLTFLMAVGIRLFRKWLPTETMPADDGSIQAAVRSASEDKFKQLFTRAGALEGGVLIAIDLAIAGIAGGLAFLAGQGAFMPVFILLLTTLGIAASFWRPVRTRQGGNELGMYLIYVFSVVVASMADIRSLSLGDNLLMLGYLFFIIFGSLGIQLIFAKIFRIDSDITVISSVTYICSPPFVPMMAAAMKNKNVLAAGLAIGVVGYAVGNYLGFAVAKLLALL